MTQPLTEPDPERVPPADENLVTIEPIEIPPGDSPLLVLWFLGPNMTAEGGAGAYGMMLRIQKDFEEAWPDRSIRSALMPFGSAVDLLDDEALARIGLRRMEVAAGAAAAHFLAEWLESGKGYPSRPSMDSSGYGWDQAIARLRNYRPPTPEETTPDD